MYKGEANWEYIAEVKNDPQIQIPIFGNGDINTPEKALEYKEKYLDAFQYFQARCQHHMHPISNMTKKRLVPNACRPVGNKKKTECKHGAPWIERLNTTRPLLICKKIAKKKTQVQWESKCSWYDSRPSQ